MIEIFRFTVSPRYQGSTLTGERVFQLDKQNSVEEMDMRNLLDILSRVRNLLQHFSRHLMKFVDIKFLLLSLEFIKILNEMDMRFILLSLERIKILNFMDMRFILCLKVIQIIIELY